MLKKVHALYSGFIHNSPHGALQIVVWPYNGPAPGKPHSAYVNKAWVRRIKCCAYQNDNNNTNDNNNDDDDDNNDNDDDNDSDNNNNDEQLGMLQLKPFIILL